MDEFGFRRGLLLGLLIGEGSFGRQGKHPSIAVKMHVRHQPLLNWLRREVLGSELHGPYESQGRTFMQWYSRGWSLEQVLIPMLDELSRAPLDPHSYGRYQMMKDGVKAGGKRKIPRGPSQVTPESLLDATELFAGSHGLSDAAADALARLLAALAAEPDPPTTVQDPQRALDLHVADSLSLLETVELPSGARLVDMGAGAGFPGLALALARPAVSVDLVESTKRSTAVIERLATAAELQNVRVLPERLEEWAAGEGREAYDYATARALAPLPVVLEYAAPLLRLGGTLVVWKGKRRGKEEDAAIAAAGLLGFGPPEILESRPFETAHSRHLHIYEKVEPTPDRFPRRAGIALKRPLA